MLNCVVDHILQEFYTLFLSRFRTYKIASIPQTKMTNKDDIYGLVSLKFLRPCEQEGTGDPGDRKRRTCLSSETGYLSEINFYCAIRKRGRIRRFGCKIIN